MQGNKDDTWSMDTVENTVELPFTYRAMVSNTFRHPPLLLSESNFDGSPSLPSFPRVAGSSIWKRVAKELERAYLDPE